MTTPSDRPVTIINVTPSLAIRLTIYGMMLLAIGLEIMSVLLEKIGYTSHSDTAWLVIGVKITAVYFVTLALHEAVHGFFFWVFGGHPKYGAGLAAWFLPYFYATAPGDPFTLFQMTVIGLAPFVVLSAASLALLLLGSAWSTIAAAAFVTNFSGATGDLWFVGQILRFRHCRDLRLIDLKSGLAVHSSDPEAKAIAERLPDGRIRALSGLLVHWFVASAILFTSIFPAAILLDLLHMGNTTIGPSWFPLFSVVSVEGQSFGISFGGNAILVTGLLLALLFLPFDVFKRKRNDDSGSGSSPHPAFL
jgi:Putative zincin peptidase